MNPKPTPVRKVIYDGKVIPIPPYNRRGASRSQVRNIQRALKDSGVPDSNIRDVIRAVTNTKPKWIVADSNEPSDDTGSHLEGVTTVEYNDLIDLRVSFQ